MSKERTSKAVNHWAALLFMLCGLGVLAAQRILPDETWTEAQQQELEELQLQLHRTPEKDSLKERDEREVKIQSQMNALEMARINQQEANALQQRWFRIIGTGLLCIGLGLYFIRRANAD